MMLIIVATMMKYEDKLLQYHYGKTIARIYHVG